MKSIATKRKLLAALVGVLMISFYLVILVTVSFQNNKFHKELRQRWTSGQNYSNLFNTNSPLRDQESTNAMNSSKVSKDDRERRLPQCLIIGFSKCGTTALRAFLSLHPLIVSPLREIRYFTLRYQNGLDWYRNQMPLSTADQVTVEKSAGYITSLESLERIHRMNATLKLVVMVRDPITRLQSEYARCVSTVNVTSTHVPTFKSWCGGLSSPNVLRLVDYATPLSTVYSLFSKEQVLVLSEELLEEKPLDVLGEVEAFLGLKPGFSKTDLAYNEEKGFYCFNTSSPRYPQVKTNLVLNERTGCFGSHKGRAHPEIGDKFLQQLVSAIQPYNQRLFRLIGKTFSWAHFNHK
ncbi:heparan sulfate glucosamine 3-O-sulfotransferase 5 [Elysia marginata]|uniref:Heparan sulfate glucosamine 3-O-sulfotransferase 5 n=1 Tax=Elysia marginata TaxID=1093978 RepID=A0AAV4K237_9GAST|nr:heparan sulfate glucosamine 3-O-sulfotransferase 5 [Elysia marginata]